MQSRPAIAGVLMGLVLVGLAASVGCTAAQAEPLEVTYYYLPG